jgi:ketosteroid isomerase-like protein
MRIPRLTAALLGAAWIVAAPAPQCAEPGPVDVVRSFNEAITRRDLPAALALVANGSVKFTLHAAHAGMPAAPVGPVTGDLKAHWSQVGSLLFMVTKSYRREPAIIDTRVDGDLATVWAKTASETVEREGKPSAEQFVELYLLVRTPDGWKIGAIADNRRTDAIAVK